MPLASIMKINKLLYNLPKHNNVYMYPPLNFHSGYTPLLPLKQMSNQV